MAAPGEEVPRAATAAAAAAGGEGSHDDDDDAGGGEDPGDDAATPASPNAGGVGAGPQDEPPSEPESEGAALDGRSFQDERAGRTPPRRARRAGGRRRWTGCDRGVARAPCAARATSAGPREGDGATSAGTRARGAIVGSAARGARRARKPGGQRAGGSAVGGTRGDRRRERRGAVPFARTRRRRRGRALDRGGRTARARRHRERRDEPPRTDGERARGRRPPRRRACAGASGAAAGGWVCADRADARVGKYRVPPKCKYEKSWEIFFTPSG